MPKKKTPPPVGPDDGQMHKVGVRFNVGGQKWELEVFVRHGQTLLEALQQMKEIEMTQSMGFWYITRINSLSAGQSMNAQLPYMPYGIDSGLLGGETGMGFEFSLIDMGRLIVPTTKIDGKTLYLTMQDIVVTKDVEIEINENRGKYEYDRAAHPINSPEDRSRIWIPEDIIRQMRNNQFYFHTNIEDIERDGYLLDERILRGDWLDGTAHRFSYFAGKKISHGEYKPNMIRLVPPPAGTMMDGLSPRLLAWQMELQNRMREQKMRKQIVYGTEIAAGVERMGSIVKSGSLIQEDAITPYAIRSPLNENKGIAHSMATEIPAPVHGPNQIHASAQTDALAKSNAIAQTNEMPQTNAVGQTYSAKQTNPATGIAYTVGIAHSMSSSIGFGAAQSNSADFAINQPMNENIQTGPNTVKQSGTKITNKNGTDAMSESNGRARTHFIQTPMTANPAMETGTTETGMAHAENTNTRMAFGESNTINGMETKQTQASIIAAVQMAVSSPTPPAEPNKTSGSIITAAPMKIAVLLVRKSTKSGDGDEKTKGQIIEAKPIRSLIKTTGAGCKQSPKKDAEAKSVVARMNNPAASCGESDPRTASGGRVRKNLKLGTSIGSWEPMVRQRHPSAIGGGALPPPRFGLKGAKKMVMKNKRGRATKKAA